MAHVRGLVPSLRSPLSSITSTLPSCGAVAGSASKCVTVAALQAAAWGGAAAGPGHQHHLSHRASIAALAGAGFPVTATDILTAPVIATAYLKEHYPGARCLLLNIGDIGEDLAGVALPTRTTRPVSSSNGFT